MDWKTTSRARAVSGTLAVALTVAIASEGAAAQTAVAPARVDAAVSTSGPQALGAVLPPMCASRFERPERDPGLRARLLPTPGGAIAYYRFGQGDPVVLITGYRATLEEWDANFLAALAKHHEVVVFDNRGVGQSYSASAEFGVEDMAHDTATLIRALGLARSTVLGWSMGGLIAQQLAVDQPELIGRLVLLSTQAPGQRGLPVPPAVLATLDGGSPHPFADVTRMLFPVAAQAAALRCFVDAMFRPLDYAAARFPATVAAAQARILEQWRNGDQMMARLRRLTVPTTVIAGRQDAVLSPRNAVVLAQAVPHARLVLFSDAGHALMYQYPDALASAVDGGTQERGGYAGPVSGHAHRR